MNRIPAEPKTFVTTIKIRFRDADPAGIMFFGNILGLAHDVFEEFIGPAGISWKEWFQPEKWACPIRHAEVEYLSPFAPGHEYSAEAKVLRIGETSFQMGYEFRTLQGKPCARVSIVHTFVDNKSFTKTEVPDLVRTKLTPYLAPNLVKE